MREKAVEELAAFAQKHLPGSITTDLQSLERYATDMGMYRIPPLAAYRVVGEHDLSRIVTFAADRGIPLIPRAGGSNTGGNAIGRGVVLLLDDATELREIGEPFAVDGEWRITVGAAVRHDRLQKRLAEAERYLPSDPSSGPLSYIGGNIATKASGPHALRHGAIDRYLRRIRYVAADGRVVDTSALEEAERSRILRLRTELEALPAARRFLESRRAMKSAAGYNIRALLDHDDPGLALAKLFAGSLGTLGFVTEAALATERVEHEKGGLLLHFASLESAAAFVPRALQYGPAAIEILNAGCLEIVRSRAPALEVPSQCRAMLIAEFEGDGDAAIAEKTRREATDSIGSYTARAPAELESLWRVRKRLLLELRHLRPGHVAPALVNDVGVPVAALASFIRKAENVFERYRLTAPIYGHAGDGNLHLRPLVDATRSDLPDLLARVSEEIYHLVIDHGGTISGEHGVGRQRAAYLSHELPPELYSFMEQVKSTFDPQGICNPESMFENHAVTDHLYLG